MRTSSTIAGVSAALLLALGGQALALEPQKPQAARAAPIATFSSVKEALRSGVRDYNAGDKVGAARALEYAATKGHTLARWKLGRMYAEGDGVPHDDLKAFEHFSSIADENADEPPDAPNARVVASAFVSLGTYFLDGIRGTYVKANPGRAHEMFHYAASYFGDPDAQYNLARLYLDGTGVTQDARQAARWFHLAAEKGHYPAQAVLGHMLVNGQGVPRQRAQGLMWLTLAKDAADPAKDGWIAELHAKAYEAASETDRRGATASVEQWVQRKR